MDTQDLENQARQAAQHYEATTQNALQTRDEELRKLHKKGLTQAAIARSTGYTRETIRQILDPKIREAARQAAAKRRAAKTAKKNEDT